MVASLKQGRYSFNDSGGGHLPMSTGYELVHDILHHLLIIGDGSSNRLIYHSKALSLKVLDNNLHSRCQAL